MYFSYQHAGNSGQEIQHIYYTRCYQDPSLHLGVEGGGGKKSTLSPQRCKVAVC